MIQAFIFDIDGTLLDSNEAHAESFVKAFEKFGKKVSFDELICLIGMGADDILEKFLSEAEIKEFGEELKEFRKDIFLKNYLPDVKVFPKVRELFEKISESGRKIALASSAGDEEIRAYHEKLKIKRFIEEETSADDAEEAKPEPDIFEAAFRKLKIEDKSEVLIVGDTIYDAEAASKAGIKIIGVESGGWTAEKLYSEGCVKVYRDAAEIFEGFEDLPV